MQAIPLGWDAEEGLLESRCFRVSFDREGTKTVWYNALGTSSCTHTVILPLPHFIPSPGSSKLLFYFILVE